MLRIARTAEKAAEEDPRTKSVSASVDEGGGHKHGFSSPDRSGICPDIDLDCRSTISGGELPFVATGVNGRDVSCTCRRIERQEPCHVFLSLKKRLSVAQALGLSVMSMRVFSSVLTEWFGTFQLEQTRGNCVCDTRLLHDPTI